MNKYSLQKKRQLKKLQIFYHKLLDYNYVVQQD